MRLQAQAQSLAAGLPALLLAAERLAFVAAPGVHGRKRPGAGEDFWQFRDFREGDEPRRIDWRRSASGQRLLLRERERQAQAVCTLSLAGGAGMYFASSKNLPQKWQRGALLLLALACLLLDAGERVALAGITPPLAGRGALGRGVLEQLALALLAGGKADPQTPAQARPAQAASAQARQVVFGDFLEPSPVFSAPAGGAVMQILDPAECDFPYTGRVVFEGPGGLKTTPVEAARAQIWGPAYKARLAAQRADVAAAAQACGQTPLFHRTDSPPAPALAALFLALRRA